MDFVFSCNLCYTSSVKLIVTYKGNNIKRRYNHWEYEKNINLFKL